MILSDAGHAAVLDAGDRLGLPLTFRTRGEIMLESSGLISVPPILAPSELLLLPVGFRANGASIPQGAWSLIGHPFMPDVLVPSLVHDRLYQTQLVTRQLADWVFYIMLLGHGAPRWKAEAMYRAVDWFGGQSWQDHQLRRQLTGITSLPATHV